MVVSLRAQAGSQIGSTSWVFQPNAHTNSTDWHTHTKQWHRAVILVGLDNLSFAVSVKCSFLLDPWCTCEGWSCLSNLFCGTTRIWSSEYSIIKHLIRPLIFLLFWCSWGVCVILRRLPRKAGGGGCVLEDCFSWRYLIVKKASCQIAVADSKQADLRSVCGYFFHWRWAGISSSWKTMQLMALNMSQEAIFGHPN